MNRIQYLFMMAALFAAAAFISYLICRKKGKAALISLFALTGGILRISYVLYTPHWVRQHDVVGFGNDFGQAAYIEWFYKNFRLPDFDPREKWGFFQPPLHHMCSALFMHLQTLVGIAYNKACENVMLLTLCYSLLILLYAWRILKQMQLSGWALYLSFALVAIHPGFILLGGSINNDCLCELLMVMGLYYTIEWYRNPGIIGIVKIALCTGLSMMTKLSGFLIAPGIAFIFIVRWIRGGRQDFIKYLRQYIVFAMISLPLGLFYPVRNFIRFDVPFNFTPEVGEPVGSFSLLQRLFDIRTKTPFACMINHGDAYDEYNVFLAMLKTSIFGETNLSEGMPKMIPFAWVALITGGILTLFALAATIIVLIKTAGTYIRNRKKGALRNLKDSTDTSTETKEKRCEPTMIADGTEIAFWGISWIIPLVFLINFSFSAPYFSSQDFRYIQYVIVVEALFTGLYLKMSGSEEKPGVSGKAYAFVLILFTAAVTAVYVLLGAASIT